MFQEVCTKIVQSRVFKAQGGYNRNGEFAIFFMVLTYRKGLNSCKNKVPSVEMKGIMLGIPNLRYIWIPKNIVITHIY